MVTYFLVFDSILAFVNNQSDEKFSLSRPSYNLTFASRTKIVGSEKNNSLEQNSTTSTNLGNKFNSSEEQTKNESSTKKVLLKMLRFVKEKGIMDYQSISIILNTENCNIGMLCEDIIRFLISSENNFPFHIVYIDDEATDTDIYQKLNRSFQGYHKTLLILDNLFETYKMPVIFELVDKSFLENRIWLFLDRGKETTNASMAIEYISNNKLYFSSQIYILSGDSEIGILSELYKKCQSVAPNINHIVTLVTSSGVSVEVDFIWYRWQNLKACSLRVAILNDPSFVYKTETNEFLNNSKDCLARNELTI